MPSKKKARGRQHRAKKEATRTAELRSMWEPTVLRGNPGVVTVPCEHTLALPPIIPQESPAVSFMNCLAGEGFFSGNLPVDFCIETALRFPEVRGSESERSLAIGLLLRFVRNVIVRESLVEGENWFHNRAKNEEAICSAIGALEIYGKNYDEFEVNWRTNKIWRKFAGGNRRDVVKFVAKRLPCTCLKELHRAAREKVAKIGLALVVTKGFQCQSCLSARVASTPTTVPGRVRGTTGLSTRKAVKRIWKSQN